MSRRKVNLTDDHRCENRYLFRLFEKFNQAQEGIQHVRVNLRDGHSFVVDYFQGWRKAGSPPPVG